MQKKKNKNSKKKRSITKLHESIHLLNVIFMGIERDVIALQGLANSNTLGENLFSINYLTFKYGIIQVQSYLDEYKKYFIKELNNDQRKKIEPYYNRINKELTRFPGMKKYRNNALAHNLRTDNRNSIFLHSDFRHYQIPQNIKEYMFIVKCLSILTKTINLLFPNMYDETLAAVTEREINNKNSYRPMLSDDELNNGIEQLENDLDALGTPS